MLVGWGLDLSGGWLGFGERFVWGVCWGFCLEVGWVLGGLLGVLGGLLGVLGGLSGVLGGFFEGFVWKRFIFGVCLLEGNLFEGWLSFEG